MSSSRSQRKSTLHTREFLADSLTPLAVYRRLAEISETRFLFESVTGGEQVSRYSFIGAGPSSIYRLFPDRLEREANGECRCLDGQPLERLAAEVADIRTEAGEYPFTGGFVGYFGYDFVRMLERLPGSAVDPFNLPLALLGRFDAFVVFDHAKQRVVAMANEIEGEVDRSEALNRLDQLSDLLTQAGEGSAEKVPEPESADRVNARISLGADEFRQRVQQAQEYIAAGDIFQVVLARRWRIEAEVGALSLYRALRLINPSPYMVLFDTPEVTLIGASPEMLVRIVGSRMETRPIAGTRPRSVISEEDERLAAELLADSKERAEHVMLVDLGRNDIGKVAAAGSVRIPSFMEIERYSHVMHIVSSVEGELEPQRTAWDALVSCFPAGTVSGAPKIRAMEIIDELEPERRGPYAGAVGYLSYSGDLDTCITIRTLVATPGEVSYTAGAGIVADSDPQSEVEETENKAAAMLSAVKLASLLDKD